MARASKQEQTQESLFLLQKISFTIITKFSKKQQTLLWLSAWQSITLPDLSLNASQSDIDDEHEERSHYRDENEEDVQQGVGNH